MDTKKIIVVLILHLLVLNVGWAQAIKPKASVDSIHLLIGDQARFQLEIEFPNSLEVQFPVFANKLNEFVEIIDQSKIDTLKIDNNTLKMIQSYTITSFDSGTHVIEPIWFGIKDQNINDSVSSNAVLIHIYNIPKIDSLIQALQGPIDIKAPYEAPVTLKEVAPWILGSLLVAALIFLIIYAISRIRKNKPIFGMMMKPWVPAHVIALQELDKIKEDKLWTQGHTKRYYSELTGVLRSYIENRFGINAPEQTTDETLTSVQMQSALVDEESYLNLKKILLMADLVKFAKYEPLPDDHNMALVNAYFFVNKTKLTEITFDEKPKDETQVGDEVIIK